MESSTEEHFSKLHRCELKSSSLDQVETLEEKVWEMKQEMTKVQRETSMAV